MKHATELELAEPNFDAIELAPDFVQGLGIVVRRSQLQQFTQIRECGIDPGQIAHHPFQRRALAAQGLGSIGIIPDAGLCELQFQFFEAMLAIGEVKDTP